MTALIRCECGWECRAETGDEIVAAMERHVVDDHPDLPCPPSRADVLAMADETPAATFLQAGRNPARAE